MRFEHPHGPHREGLRGRDQAVRHRERGFTAHPRGLAGLSEAAELPLRERAEHHHALGETGGDGGRRVADRGRNAAAARAPLHVGEAQLAQPQRGGQPRRLVAIVGIRSEPVDVGDVDAGIVAGRANRAAGEHELGVRRFAAPVVDALADPGDRHPPAQRSRHEVFLIRA